MNKYFFVLIFPIIFSGACSRVDVTWAVGGSDFRDLPAVVAAWNKSIKSKIKIDIVENSGIDAIASGKATAAYADAAELLTAMAKKTIDVDVLAVTYRVKSGKPERLLVVNRNWRNANPDGAGYIIRAHKAGIRAMKSDVEKNSAIACAWLKKASPECEAIYNSARWESGLYVDELIDILDELRAAGVIDGKESDDLALRLLQTKTVSAE